VWISLRWYPVLLLLYSGGIAAVAARKYENLRALMHAELPDPARPRVEISLIRGIVDCLGDAWELFERIPGHERQYAPLSEYLFKRFQRPSASQRGYGHVWRKVRAQILKRDPICMLCRSAMSAQCDHIRSKRDGGDDSPTNLRGVCRRCHDARTGRQGRRAR